MNMQYISYPVCAIAGLLLFGIGFIGATDLPAQPISSLTILLEPLGAGPKMDMIYWEALMVLGFWITLCYWVRVPAGIALCLVIGKIAVVKGVLPLLATTGLVVAVILALIAWQAIELFRKNSD